MQDQTTSQNPETTPNDISAEDLKKIRGGVGEAAKIGGSRVEKSDEDFPRPA